MKHQTAAALRADGREPSLPFTIALDDGRLLVLQRLLRVLPGKRIVGEAELAGRRVLAKLFIAPHSRRHWQRECEGIGALRAAGIPSPEVCHAGQLASGGHALLTDFIADASSLAEHWAAVADRPAGAAEALAVLAPAFTMLGRLHVHGLVQDDLHLGNFLVSAGRLLVIDGDAVRALSPGQPLSAAEAMSNFALLAAQLPSAWDEQLAVLVGHWHAGAQQVGGNSLPSLDPALLQAAISRCRQARLKDFLAKSGRECTLFKVDKSFKRLRIVVRSVAASLDAVLADPDRALARGRLLKDGGTCTVAQLEEGRQSIVIKRYNLKNTRHALARAWRPSRAAHSWRASHLLTFLGIATPAALALIEERAGPLRRRAWLVNAWCPGPDLATHLAPYVDDGPPAAEADALQRLFVTLHRERISHGDLKATNLLWHAGRIVLIDLDALRQHRSAATHARAWRRDRARLLRNWPPESALWRWLDAHLPPA